MFYTALLLGLLGSFHCVGMCGPIAFMLPVSRDNKVKKVFQIFLYHAGRLLAYSIIGLAFGLIGKSLNLFGFQQQLSIFIGALMILVILLPLLGVHKLNFSGPLTMFIGKIKSSMGAAFKKKTADTFLSIGFLNGFLPCGLVYMAVFGAVATGDIFSGSIYMLMFGIGTIPLMTTAVYFSNLTYPFPAPAHKEANPCICCSYWPALYITWAWPWDSLCISRAGRRSYIFWSLLPLEKLGSGNLLPVNQV
jgi:uncharacterized protein